MTEKTNIDDIIGIVKTEEKTDSVELKKEYYKNQSKDKHYTYLNYSKDGYIGSFYENDKPLTNKEVWNILNEQKKEIEYLETKIKENEWYWNTIDEDRDVWHYKCNQAEKGVKELKDENKQLKQYNEEEIKFMSDINGIYRSALLDLEYDMKKLEEENKQLKKDRFICLDCKYCGHTEIGCLCEKQDHWEDFKNECNDFKELKY